LIVCLLDSPKLYVTFFFNINFWRFANVADRNQLIIPIAIITSAQKENTYSGVKMYNSQPSNILNLKNDRKQSRNKLCGFVHLFCLNVVFF